MGILADGANATLYGLEGEYQQAGLTMLGPLSGGLGKILKPRPKMAKALCAIGKGLGAKGVYDNSQQAAQKLGDGDVAGAAMAAFRAVMGMNDLKGAASRREPLS